MDLESPTSNVLPLSLAMRRTALGQRVGERWHWC